MHEVIIECYLILISKYIFHILHMFRIDLAFGWEIYIGLVCVISISIPIEIISWPLVEMMDASAYGIYD